MQARRLFGALIGGVVLACSIAGFSWGLENVVIDGTEVTATRDGTNLKATIKLLNNGKEQQSLPPTITVGPQCVVRVDPASVALQPLRATSVNLLLDAACFDGGKAAVVVRLDAGATPEVTIKAADPPVDPLALIVAGPVGLIVGALTWGFGRAAYRATRERLASDVLDAKQIAAYESVQRIVNTRIKNLAVPAPGTVTELGWRQPNALAVRYELTSTMDNLAADWSLKDSWAVNLTVSSAALAALVTSTDAIGLVTQSFPKQQLVVVTAAGLITAVVVAIAALVVRLIGKPTEVTVLGLLISSSLIAAAAAFQVTAIGFVAGVAVGGPSNGKAWIAYVLALTAGAVMICYCIKSLRRLVMDGAQSVFPKLPEDPVAEWAATEPWEGAVVEQSIRRTYARWLNEPTTSPDGSGAIPPSHGAPLAPIVVPKATTRWARKAALI